MDREKNLRKRIITYAGPLFFEQGFSRITTEELCRRMGISKKTLYKEFDSKEELVREAVLSRLRAADAELSTIFEDENRSIVERIGSQMKVATRILQTLSTAFLSDLSRYAPELWEEIQEFRHRRVFDRLEGMINSGKREGTIKPELDSKLLVLIIITIADKLLVPAKIVENGIDPREMIRLIGMLIGGGILTETGRGQLLEKGLFEEKGAVSDD